MPQAIIKTAKTVRQLAIKQIEAIPEELFDSRPEGFSNTVRWNVGHIISSFDFFLTIGGITFTSHLPENYRALFSTGTRPSDWSEAGPSKEELLSLMSGQLAIINEITPDVLNQTLQTPVELGFLRFDTVGEIFNFAFIHEAMHLTTISCIVKVSNK